MIICHSEAQPKNRHALPLGFIFGRTVELLRSYLTPNDIECYCQKLWFHSVFSIDRDTQKEVTQQHGDILYLNWLFNFDRVEIINATDQEGEQFAIQVGYDTDPIRRSRYKFWLQAISPARPHSENSQRGLAHTFGRIIEATQVTK